DLLVQRNGGIVLLTHGDDNTFSASTVSADSTGEIAAGDVDGDGQPDVVGFFPGELNVYHHGSGWNRTEIAPAGIPGGAVDGVEVADVNSDGRADILATILGNQPNSLLDVYRQNSDGSMAEPDVYHVPDIPQPVVAADMNGD